MTENKEDEVLKKLDEIERIMKKWDSYLKVFEFIDKQKERNQR